LSGLPQEERSSSYGRARFIDSGVAFLSQEFASTTGFGRHFQNR
jgi:hypothetical protein